MADDEDDDLYEEEFDFVDDEDEEDNLDEDEADDSSETDDETGDDETSDIDAEDSLDGEVDQVDPESDEAGEGSEVDEYGRPGPTANYLVHVYEYSKFKRTIDRPFTPEDAEAFATEYNRTAKSYGRVAIAGKNDVKPKKAIND
jgi:hypothetical protein